LGENKGRISAGKGVQNKNRIFLILKEIKYTETQKSGNNDTAAKDMLEYRIQSHHMRHTERLRKCVSKFQNYDRQIPRIQII
jgi:hypothetical protein